MHKTKISNKEKYTWNWSGINPLTERSVASKCFVKMFYDFIKKILFAFNSRGDQSTPSTMITTTIAQEDGENSLYAVVENCLKDNVSYSQCALNE